MQLPIESALPALKEALHRQESAVLVAPPGAGKTTRVPLALLEEPWLAGRRILMLEPRRLAARSAARYMAASLREQVGQTVGYRVRMDTRVGPATRIEVITEGVLTRFLQTDPALEDVGLIIFDEFHERSLHADLGLALSQQSQSVLREDLRILIMSATLDAEPVSALLRDAPVVVSEGRAFSVETHYINKPINGHIEPAVVQAILHALDTESGDILVFLPGAAEIKRVEAELLQKRLGNDIRIAPLYGRLSREAQDMAVSPCPPGERKVVLATSIAETSLTVEGVRIVIDSGMARVPRFSPRTGMTRLETVRVSRASADQRRGRAGRQGPGVCYRLWTEQEQRLFAPRSTPEILEADLTALALELAAWGISNPDELLWLDPPPGAAFSQARELLTRLGALDERGLITTHGRRMADFGVHPRLAHMLLKADALGLGSLACELAAVLNERDVLRDSALNADLRLRIEAIRNSKKNGPGFGSGPHMDSAVSRRILAEVNQWQKMLELTVEGEEDNGEMDDTDLEKCGLLLAFAYPDRIAQRKPTGKFLLRNGRGAILPKLQPLSNTSYLVAAELDDQTSESRILLAAPVELSLLEHHFSEQIKTERTTVWDKERQAVKSRKRMWLGALLLQDVPITDADMEILLNALLSGVADEGLEILPWTKTARQFRQRLAFMHTLDNVWPDVSDEALIASLTDWLGPHVYGLRSRSDLQKLNMVEIIQSILPWEQRRELDEHAPSHITVPSGSRIPVDYSDPSSPVLAVRLQEMFGLKETPRIGRAKIPLMLHLLSPAQRPVQVTRDLASFWKNAYFEVKKDLKGRYPKHYWPDDPVGAVPTNRTKPRQA
ncbi:ATP-dependent helicase HrpB [Aneurinibacillus sp. Ricciae_BoGa-3]|uniref:ATP-dependent helicase HrpB n=1 Tax=Aneurinibacillus sp. Ricciae_BoGa-3 TaxID=3022697 RepID=UPI00234269B6|nr:ATP-dependent helicase HrpB [Aneurinibacillus sp. Ricciae_BoGa-3]WCK54463.1 ATP-dependent helicase HrpB [Aneurinibacillus sp. Ricciae_BoGa-3]